MLDYETFVKEKTCGHNISSNEYKVLKQNQLRKKTSNSLLGVAGNRQAGLFASTF